MVLENICSIIQGYLDLENGQVYLRQEKISLPKDFKFSISVGFIGSGRSLGTTRRGTTSETVSTTMAHNVVIEIYGRTFDVLTKKDEIILAVNSSLSMEIQQKNGFYIAPNPSTQNDLSGLDGAAIPYRFQLTFPIQYKVEKTKTQSYYASFEREVKTNA